MILLLAIALSSAAQPRTGCAVDQTAMLAMSVDRFDQSDAGWRRIGEKAGCELAGAALVQTYRRANAGRLNADQRAQLAWHQGQLLAMGGDRPAAIRIFTGIIETEPAQRQYQQATVAFLRRDRTALLAARSKLAAIPKPPGFDALAARFKRQTGQDVRWPENLDIVDALIRCFDSSYGVAYGNGCPRVRRAAGRSGR